MEYRSSNAYRTLYILIALGFNVFAGFVCFSEASAPVLLFLLIGLFINAFMAYRFLEENRILLFSDRMELFRGFLYLQPDPEKFAVRFNTITRIKRVRGNRGGPRYTVYFTAYGNEDRVEIANWDVADAEGLMEELSRRSKVPMDTRWFF